VREDPSFGSKVTTGSLLAEGTVISCLERRVSDSGRGVFARLEGRGGWVCEVSSELAITAEVELLRSMNSACDLCRRGMGRESWLLLCWSTANGSIVGPVGRRDLLRASSPTMTRRIGQCLALLGEDTCFIPQADKANWGMKRTAHLSRAQICGRRSVTVKGTITTYARVVGNTMDLYFRLQGHRGWLFETREGERTLQEIAAGQQLQAAGACSSP
jgi:hypothetical protein